MNSDNPLIPALLVYVMPVGVLLLILLLMFLIGKYTTCCSPEAASADTTIHTVAIRREGDASSAAASHDMVIINISGENNSNCRRDYGECAISLDGCT
ncbi:hypothetical protein ACH5RR_009681 [Cinchona calisaya]|uniref:Uncharacterized protein n=1 Tax=Cinchona calisaya TaxID=153742 RepID=A0ABD3AGS6_9GENT